MTKMGFYYDQRKCSGCRTCQVACKDKNDLEVGTLFRHVTSFQAGKYPEAVTYHYAATCNHCEQPACVAACPSGAMYVDDEDGTVQRNDEVCIGCKSCVEACPYAVPQYVETKKIVQKCNACIELRGAGEPPACVAACTMRALEFGSVDELKAKHPDAVSDIVVLPDSSATTPCTFITPKQAALVADPVEVIM